MHHRKLYATPVVSGRQECPHGGDLGPPRPSSLAVALGPLCGGMRSNMHQVSLDAMEHFTHKCTHVLTQDSDQAAEQVTRPGRDSLQQQQGELDMLWPANKTDSLC